MNEAMMLHQKRILHKIWKFECEQLEEDLFVFKKTIDDVKIVWNIKHQVGAYTINGESLSLILNWETLEDLMDKIQ